MITIIHGDDISSSRQFYLEQKQKSKNRIEFEGEKITLSELSQIIGGQSLFGEQKDVFIENFLSSKKSKDLKPMIDFLKNNHKNLNVFLWEKQQLTSASVTPFKDAIVKKFSLPQALFSFLDSIVPGNSTKSIKLFHETLESSKEEVVFFMLVRQFRLLLALSENSEDEQIDEFKRMVPWQKPKLAKQAERFGKDQLITNYKKLFEIDLGIKTGASSLPLTQSIDFFLLSL